MKKLVLALCMFCIAPLALATQQLDEAILGLRQAWDQANYALQGGQKEKALEAVAARADALVQQWPGRAEPLVWKGIALASAIPFHTSGSARPGHCCTNASARAATASRAFSFCPPCRA